MEGSRASQAWLSLVNIFVLVAGAKRSFMSEMPKGQEGGWAKCHRNRQSAQGLPALSLAQFPCSNIAPLPLATNRTNMTSFACTHTTMSKEREFPTAPWFIGSASVFPQALESVRCPLRSCSGMAWKDFTCPIQNTQKLPCFGAGMAISACFGAGMVSLSTSSRSRCGAERNAPTQVPVRNSRWHSR